MNRQRMLLIIGMVVGIATLLAENHPSWAARPVTEPWHDTRLLSNPQLGI